MDLLLFPLLMLLVMVLCAMFLKNDLKQTEQIDDSHS